MVAVVRGSVVLDDVDRGLLQALVVDRRASFARIGEVLGVSDRTVARRYFRCAGPTWFASSGTSTRCGSAGPSGSSGRSANRVRRRRSRKPWPAATTPAG
ncbi:AsnC family protein [Umezawaea sp.]|uniref:AsnC family protein n=1 Tax=Umezawaea sp. TaxID=1955258 RepID=UPI002ED17173